ncbi:bifunctional folylpolyglutamate synthase/dihydrofolate synthase [Limihaloglobus sulfuriphilus]|uniref:bifunctional folylpolyglutamate synthase/dihydrofolate synthase n=1 Tax=Limihaloglobus sulfuriphilus TaxID=1851148 RepID=UPI0011BADDE0|nr:folylpolyglutamate synthase/dihydrofolate synthase family protein [Limihaloglobus sulfuriphilus]
MKKTTAKKTATKKASAKKTAAPKKNKTLADFQKVRPFNNYDKALNYLFSVTDYERARHMRYNVDTFDLERMSKLLELLGNPHKGKKFIHVAGTKGKGSTATLLARLLQANGFKVGLYTSPHLLSLHERIEFNSRRIDQNELSEMINKSRPVVEYMEHVGMKPTFFEIFTALAILYFDQMGADISVLETGLGGRLDATNVVDPLVSIITRISIDHQYQLGRTIDKIAYEKAGIIKPGVPVVTVEQEEAALQVISEVAEKKGSPLWVINKNVNFSARVESSPEYGPHARICVDTETSMYHHIRVPLPGEHQAENLALALAAIDQLKRMEYEIDDEKIIEGIETVSLPGRMELIWNDPKVLIDVAHNAASIKALIRAVGQHVPYDSMVMIFGCNRDKDVVGMLKELQYGADKLIFTRSNFPKAVSPTDLAELYTEHTGKMCQTATSLGEALQIARRAVNRDDLICITGSFYLAGQAKERFIKAAQRA